MKNDLFDETFVLINCVLKNKILTIAMINIDVTEYAFVDESVAQSLCEVLKIEFVELIKKRLIKVYDERKNQIIIHVIYSKMIIQKHIKSLISMLIIKLRQQTLILDKSWMRKHDVSYHEKTNIIEFYSEFCTHAKRIKTTDKEKNISFEKKSFLNQSDHFKFDESIKNSRKFIKIIKILFWKEICSDQSAINFSRKDKKSTKSVEIIKNSKTIKDSEFIKIESEISNSKEKLSEVNIAMIEASAFNMMSKRKNVNLFSIILRNVKKHFEKHNKSNTVIRLIAELSFEHVEQLDSIQISNRTWLFVRRVESNLICCSTFEFDLYKLFEILN
jgi:hypothetical protein